MTPAQIEEASQLLYRFRCLNEAISEYSTTNSPLTTLMAPAGRSFRVPVSDLLLVLHDYALQVSRELHDMGVKL